MLEVLKRTGHRLILAIDRAEVAIITGSVAGLAILLIANVIARTFLQSLYWADEVARFLMILITFVGTSYAARKARHIRMGAFLDLMPARLEKIFIIIISIFSAGVLFLLARFSFQYMNQMRMLGQTTPALQVPYWLFMIIVPIGFGMGGVQYVRTVFKNLIEDEVWLSAEQQSEYDEEITHGY
ncbi:TRAP transporter small permease [Spirochaeta africana]|uniref:TRAP-type C4-dicarboxylate transport system, small permease component n=1 Tax=Spirochaeta africana (strain ATCC 700263 / DSM 8902 / Z-7692) TaxID=889378 RepID=H9UL83_SPIAZ|nr:TRAP transporter small permease [Spirochaeta africana]AFG38276.1 TRAP-type C4-dicarboxylate transport system, small permease component [Spirochaeta africana DSM 8902]